MNWADVAWPKLLTAKSTSARAWLATHWSFPCFTIEAARKHLIHTSLSSDWGPSPSHTTHCRHICHHSRVMFAWLVTISEWHNKYLQWKQKKGLELKFLTFCMCIYAFTLISVCHRLWRSQKTKSEGTLSSHGLSRCRAKVTKLASSPLWPPAWPWIMLKVGFCSTLVPVCCIWNLSEPNRSLN